MKYRLVEAEKDHHDVSHLARVFGVSHCEVDVWAAGEWSVGTRPTSGAEHRPLNPYTPPRGQANARGRGAAPDGTIKPQRRMLAHNARSRERTPHTGAEMHRSASSLCMTISTGSAFTKEQVRASSCYCPLVETGRRRLPRPAFYPTPTEYGSSQHAAQRCIASRSTLAIIREIMHDMDTCEPRGGPTACTFPQTLRVDRELLGVVWGRRRDRQLAGVSRCRYVSQSLQMQITACPGLRAGHSYHA